MNSAPAIANLPGRVGSIIVALCVSCGSNTTRRPQSVGAEDCSAEVLIQPRAIPGRTRRIQVERIAHEDGSTTGYQATIVRRVLQGYDASRTARFADEIVEWRTIGESSLDLTGATYDAEISDAGSTTVQHISVHGEATDPLEKVARQALLERVAAWPSEFATGAPPALRRGDRWEVATAHGTAKVRWKLLSMVDCSARVTAFGSMDGGGDLSADGVWDTRRGFFTTFRGRVTRTVDSHPARTPPRSVTELFQADASEMETP